MARRSISSKRRKRKGSLLELEMTSLLDVITTLLIFLIFGYNSSGIEINVPKDITLPKSISKDFNHDAVKIMVAQDAIWVDTKKVVDLTNGGELSTDQEGRRILPLFDELVAQKELIRATENSSPRATKFSGLVNLIVDKTIKYSFVKKILYTTAEAGYKEYKFVVMSENQ
jgi:biopolymer transport protein ExbD